MLLFPRRNFALNAPCVKAASRCAESAPPGPFRSFDLSPLVPSSGTRITQAFSAVGPTARPFAARSRAPPSPSPPFPRFPSLSRSPRLSSHSSSFESRDRVPRKRTRSIHVASPIVEEIRFPEIDNSELSPIGRSSDADVKRDRIRTLDSFLTISELPIRIRTTSRRGSRLIVEQSTKAARRDLVRRDNSKEEKMANTRGKLP